MPNREASSIPSPSWVRRAVPPRQLHPLRLSSGREGSCVFALADRPGLRFRCLETIFTQRSFLDVIIIDAAPFRRHRLRNQQHMAHLVLLPVDALTHASLLERCFWDLLDSTMHQCVLISCMSVVSKFKFLCIAAALVITIERNYKI